MDQKKSMPGSEQTKGTGSDSTRNRSSESDRTSSGSGSDSNRSGSSDSGGGITNRSMEEELSEQEELPERGSRQSER